LSRETAASMSATEPPPGPDPGPFTVPGHRRVFRLALPIVLSNLSVPLVGLVDTAVMGRMPDPAYIGAVTLGAVLFSFLYWGFGFLRMGTTGLVARLLGAEDGDALRAAIARSLLLALALGTAIVLLQWPVARIARWAMPASDAVEQGMLTYYGIRVWSAPAVLVQYVLMGSFIGAQRTGHALVAQLALNLANAGLSYAFVIRLGWGIAGVGFASVIAEYFGLAVGLLLLRAVTRRVPGRWSKGSLTDWPAYRAMLVVNGNIFVRTLCLIGAFAWFNAQAARLGDLQLAANAVLLQLVNLLSYGLDGFAHAAEALVGQALGAGDRAAYRWTIRATGLWAAVTATGYSLVYALFGAAFIALMSDLPSVRAASAQYLPWVVAMPLIAVWSYQLDGIFIGSLRTREMRDGMIIALAAFVLSGFVLTALWGNHGLWGALVAFFVARALTLGRALVRGPAPFMPR